MNLLLVQVLFSARTSESFELPKVMLSRAVAIVLLAGAAAAGLARGRRDGWAAVSGAISTAAREPVGLGVLLSLAAAAVSTAASLSPRTSMLGAQGSFDGLVAAAGYAVLFFSTRGLCPDADAARSLLRGAAAGLAAAVAYGFVQLAGLDPWRWDAPVTFEGLARVFSTQGHPNSLAQLLAVGAPVAAWLALRANGERRTVEAASAALVGAGAIGLIVLTLSRAGALAAATALAVLAWGWSSAAGAPRRRTILAVAAIAALLAAALAFALLADPTGHGVQAWVARLGRRGPSADPRRFLWAAAWAAFRDHPWLGAGLDCFSLVYGRYRTAAAWSAEWGQTPLKAHCQPLEVLATRGVVGAVAAAALVGGAVVAFRRALRRPEREPFLAVAAAASLAAFAVHQLFHFPTAAGTTLALTMGAILSRLAEPAPESSKAAPLAASLPALTTGALGAVLLLHYGVLRPLRADVLGRATAVQVETDPSRALDYARRAVRLDPGRDLLWLRLAAAAQASARGEADSAARRARFEEARTAAERGVRLVPRSAYSQAHLATVLADLEREDPPLLTRAEVEAAFERARELDPHNADILMAAANAALAASDAIRAEAWAEACSRLYPAFAPPRAVMGAASLARGRELMAAGDADRAARKLEEARARLRDALEADWRGDTAARAAARANLRAAEGLDGNASSSAAAAPAR